MSIKRQVSRLFYYHGILCARFPVYILAGVILIILFFWYPLLTLSIPSRSPYEFVIDKPNNLTGSSVSPTRPWLHRPAEAVILQLLVTVHVSKQASVDALRAALAGSFELHALVRDFQHGNASLSNLCFTVDEATALTPAERRQLPAYGCLLLSPASLWQQEAEMFNSDRNLLRTVYVSPLKGKIQMVKSKWGLAFGACFTVVASLLMSVGVCMYFGIAPSLNGSETFPYLVVLIGMENVLVITKSVVSTPVELEVRHRVAVGLSKEGWTITRSLVAEVGLLSLGLLSFNTSIQEFALFAVASGLISAVSRQLHSSLTFSSNLSTTASSNPGSPGDLVEHPDYQRYWPEMAALHWPSLFGHYNRSLAGRYVTYLGAACYQSAAADRSAAIDEETVTEQPQQEQPWWFLLGRPAALHGTWGLAAICLFGVTFVLTSTYALMLCCQLCGLAWLFRLGSRA
uniref:SSD domain-containing protein n=1 Tax=Macrostomum lignano TaxID=282301 RepID=A0A1I8H428_9PLAT